MDYTSPMHTLKPSTYSEHFFRSLIKMIYLLFETLKVLTIITQVSAFTGCQKSILTVRHVASCPKDEVSWKAAAIKMNCDSITQNCAMSLGLSTQNHRFQYHCLVNSDKNATVEVCALNRFIFGKVHLLKYFRIIMHTFSIKTSFLTD